MTIRKGKTPGTVVIRPRQIVPAQLLRLVQEITVVDAVRMLVKKYKNVCRFWYCRVFEELNVVRVVEVVSTLREAARITDHRIHRVASNSRRPSGFLLVAA